MPSICKTCDIVVCDEKALKEHQKCHSRDQFICDECGKSYGKQKTLNLHVRSKHSNEFFECAQCPFKSGRKFILQRHVLSHHVPQHHGTLYKNKRIHAKKKVYPIQKYVKKENLLLAQKFECTKCKKLFTMKKNLARHVTFQHRDDMKDHSYECAICSKGFRDKNNLRKHINVCETRLQRNQSSVKEQQLYMCLLPKCETTLGNQYAMEEHYQKVHNIVLEREYLEFDSKQEFDEWRIELQRSSACQFSVSKVWKSSTSCNWRMQCHRTGRQPTKKENRIRFQKSSGSKKLNGFCPAEIVLKENKTDKICHVVIQKTHIGHSNNLSEELKFLSFDKREKSVTGSKLAFDVPCSPVILSYQGSTENNKELDSNQSMNYDDIANISAALGLNTKFPTRFTDDPQNVLCFIDEHQESILFYKAENSSDTEFGVLQDNDFALVFMSKFQENLLKKFGHNVITYNATHKTNPNDLLLHSLMVLDDDWEGVAAAFLLSNRNDGTVLEIFLLCVRERVGFLSPLTVMTDMHASFHSAFEVVMEATPQFSLWCLWHVYEGWRLNQKKIKSLEKRKRVLMMLYELSQLTDVEIFHTKLKIFINDTDPDLRSFIEYFNEEYALKTRYWAYCYRIGAKINTNMIDESFHSFLKGKICGKKKIKTVYDCLQCINTYISVKKNWSKIKNVCPRRTHKIRVLRTRHHTAVKSEGLYTVHAFHPECVDGEKCSHTWLISFEKEKKKKKGTKKSDGKCSDDEEQHVDSMSDDREEMSENTKEDDDDDDNQMYIVQRNINFRKENVSVKCTICNVALKEYSCTCIDYLIKCNLCKHIHAVAIYCKKNDCQCTCGPTLDDVSNIEISNTSNMNDDNGGDFPDFTPFEDTTGDPYDRENNIEQLRNKLKSKIDSIHDEEMLNNFLQYINFKDRPAPSEEKRN